MPERDKQTDYIARTLAGAGPRRWDTRLGERPDTVSVTDWDAARATADRVYVDMMETLDFQRILIEANKRHLAVHPDKTTLLAAADIGATTVEALCHECLREVMLATDTNPPWTEQGESPRYLIYRDPTLGEDYRLDDPTIPVLATRRVCADDFVAVDPFGDDFDDTAESENFEVLLNRADAEAQEEE